MGSIRVPTAWYAYNLESTEGIIAKRFKIII